MTPEKLREIGRRQAMAEMIPYIFSIVFIVVVVGGGYAWIKYGRLF